MRDASYVNEGALTHHALRIKEKVSFHINITDGCDFAIFSMPMFLDGVLLAGRGGGVVAA